MAELLLDGLVRGAVYGLLAAGVVRTRRSSGGLNLAQAEFGSVGAFVAFVLIPWLGAPSGIGIPAAVAASAGLALAAGLGIVGPAERAARSPGPGDVSGHGTPVDGRPGGTSGLPATLASLAVLLVTVAMTIVLAGSASRPAEPILDGAAFRAGGVTATTVHLGAAVGGGLAWAAFAWSGRRAGSSTGGPSEVWAWGSAGLLGGAAGLLHAEAVGTITPGFLTVSALVPALVAAALVRGAASAVPAGVVVGLAHEAGTEALVAVGVPGAAELVVLLLLAGALAVGGPSARLAEA